MAQNLWEVRRTKKMKVRDLAAKSGVPAPVIHQYEAGEKPISQAHLRQLARALIVDTWDIKIVSDPKPRSQPGPGGPRPPRPPKAPKPKRPPAPARPSQVDHLLRLAERFPELSRDTFEAQVGKRLEELTARELSDLLRDLQERLRQEQPPAPTPPFERHRAYLPEGVDEFELKYLTQAQEEGGTLYFTLFNGEQVEGQIIGFSPYTITLRQAGGEEMTLNKLAVAYYRKEGTGR
jgi:transcriptional regulator with XRE-family HTH domain